MYTSTDQYLDFDFLQEKENYSKNNNACHNYNNNSNNKHRVLSKKNLPIFSYVCI